MKVGSVIGFAVGPIITGFFSIITIPIVAWYFSPEDVGRFNILQVSLTFFLLFGSLALDQAYVREFHVAKSQYQLLKECLIPGLIIQLAGLCLLIYFGEFVVLKLFGLSGLGYLLVISVCVVVNFFSRFFSLILRMKEQGLDYSLSQITPKIVQTLSLLLVTQFVDDRNFFLLILISAFALTFNLIVLSYKTKNDLIFSWRSAVNYSNIKSYLKFGFPLIFASFIFWGIGASTTLLIANISNLNELAVFSVAMSFAASATIIQSIFAVIWTPLAFKWQESGVDMKKVDYVADGALVVICVVISIAGSLSFLIDYILPRVYSNVKYMVPCLILQPLLYTMSIITSIGIGIKRANKFSLYASAGALIVNIFLCVLLIQEYGASGAAIANSLSFLTLFILNTEASVLVWRDFPRKKIYIIVFSLTFLAVTNSLPGFNLLLNFNIIWLATLIGSLYYFREKITDLLNKAKKLCFT